MKLRAILNFFLGVPLTILAFIFIGKVFFDNKESILTTLSQSNPLFFVLGIIFFSFFFALKSFIWLQILKKRGFETHTLPTLLSYSMSEVRRYIPGSIFAVMGRMNNHASQVPKKETLKGIGIEVLLLTGSSLFVSIPAIYYLLGKTVNNSWIATMFIVGFVVLCVSGVMFNLKFRNTLNRYLDYFFLFATAWILYGFGCLFTAYSFSFFSPSSLFIVLSIFVASWLAGFLFFITPMGLGVRELTATFSLSFFVPLPIASTLAILTRVNMIFGELIYLLILFLLNKFYRKKFGKLDFYKFVLFLFALTYFLYFSAFTIFRHNSLMSGRFDLGNMTQTVWNTANGRFFTLTNPDGVENVSRLAVHSDFILVLFAPFYYLWSNPGVLLIGQSLILTFGSIFLYFISLEILKKKSISLVLAFSYYLNFWLAEQNIFDFHAVSLSTTFLLASFYFLLKKRYIPFTLALTFAAMTKENIFLVIPFFGLYFLLKQKKYKVGSTIALGSFFAFYFLTSVATPFARGEAHFALETYSYLGNSVFEILINLTTQPQILITQLVNFSTLYYLHMHLVTTGYLAILSPFYLLFTLPEIAIYLLSRNLEYRSYEYHFGAAIIPFIYISTIYGIRNLTTWFPFLSLRKISYYLILVSLLTAYFYSPILGFKNSPEVDFMGNDAKKIISYLDLIPPFASVSSTNEIGAHLSHREHIYVMPLGMNEAEYLVIYNNNIFLGLVDLNKYEELVNDTDFNFHIFKRKLNLSCGNCKP